MEYIIFDYRDCPLTAKVHKEDADYISKYVLPNFNPINEKEYIEGFSFLLKTAARSSYILYDNKVLWLIEWQPGLIVLELGNDGNIKFTALRSPIPNFGGREPLEIDNPDNFDEDAENYQYNLVFNPWDAQFDEELQAFYNFKPANENEIKLHSICIEQVNKLDKLAELEYEKNPSRFSEVAKKNIADMVGIGIITI